jgi:hypothetical protein
MSRHKVSTFSDIDDVLGTMGADAAFLDMSARALKQALTAALRQGSGRPMHGSWSRALLQLRFFIVSASPLVPHDCTAFHRLTGLLAENADLLPEGATDDAVASRGPIHV